MRTPTPRLLALATVIALGLAACGGSDDVSDVVDTDAAPPGAATPDVDTGTDSDETSDESGPGFGEFVSGTVTLSGAEEAIYSIDDPAYTFVGAGGCGGALHGRGYARSVAMAQ